MGGEGKAPWYGYGIGKEGDGSGYPCCALPGRPGEMRGGGRKLKEGMDGVMGGRPCGGIEIAFCCCW